MTQTEALKLALEALEELFNTNGYWWQEVDEQTLKKIEHSITAIKEALAQPEQEPVAEIVNHGGYAHVDWKAGVKHPVGTKFYTTPPQRKEPEQEPVTWKKLHEWMVRNMPSGTIISDPSWWAHHIYIRFIRDATQPQRKPLTDAMVSVAARVLNDRQADACGVDKDDQWKVYGQDFIEDARAMLNAAHRITKE